LKQQDAKGVFMRKLLLSIAMLVSLHAFANEAPWLGDARKVASSVPPKLLQTLYPADKGTGYSIGQIRGAMAVRKAL
jgi:hypothetical protein